MPKKSPPATKAAKNASGNNDLVDRCQKCQARCCRYVMIPFDTPRKKSDFDELRWLAAHRNVGICRSGHDWYIRFDSRCRFLNRHYLCSHYEGRFDICRNYDPEVCEGTDLPHEIDHEYNTLEEFDRYLKQRFSRSKKGRRARSRATKKNRPKKPATRE